MCVLAHPDDESLGTGGTLAKYAAEGVETFLVTATRGERGRFGRRRRSPGADVVGRVREAELLAAAKELGVREVTLLGYPDGALDRCDHAAAQQVIAGHLRRIRPQVVITFGPEGAYGHPDHIAIWQLTTAAIVRSADREFAVSKLYLHRVERADVGRVPGGAQKLTSTVDGVERQVVPSPDWAITTRIDTSAVWPTVWRAVSVPSDADEHLREPRELPAEHQRSLWGTQEFYRVFSLVNGGRTRESDLFEGLR